MCYSIESVMLFFRGISSAVGLSGLEPPTSRLSGVRSNRLSYKPIITIQLNIAHGYRGDKGIRTLDPLLARQVLSQLSYAPNLIKYKLS